MIVATIGSSLAADTPAGIQALAMLGFWRFILGIGIGGDYPLSSVLTSEYAGNRNARFGIGGFDIPIHFKGTDL